MSSASTRRNKGSTQRQVQAVVQSVRSLTLGELIVQLSELRQQVGGHVPVFVSERRTELACAVDVVRWPGLAGKEPEYCAARICGC